MMVRKRDENKVKKGEKVEVTLGGRWRWREGG